MSIARKNEPMIRRRLQARLTANGTLALPAYGSVKRIVVRNRTANAVTGGLNIGTSSGGQQVLAAQAVAASAVLDLTPVATVLTTTAQTLYIQAVTAWNSADLDVIVYYDEIDFNL